MIPDLRRSAAAAAAALQQHSSWFLIKVISGLCHFLQVKTLFCLTHSSRSWTQKPLPGGLMTLLQPNEEVIPTRADIRSLNKHTVHVVTPTYTADTFFYLQSDHCHHLILNTLAGVTETGVPSTKSVQQVCFCSLVV